MTLYIFFIFAESNPDPRSQSSS